MVLRVPTTDMDDLKIKFDGEPHSIDVNTFINSLIHLTTIAQGVNEEIAPDRKVDVRIVAPEKGSFIVHIMLQSNLIDAARNLFTADNIKIAGTIATSITAIYKLVKTLRGEKPKSISSEAKSGDLQVRIEGVKGDVIYIDQRVYNAYSEKPQIQEAVKKEFETLEGDENVTGFEVLDKDNNSLVRIDREEFAAIAGGDDEQVGPDEKIESEVGMLSIHTLSFDNKAKWVFYYNGHRITAKISDQVFADRIDKGESFAKGDSLEAEIEVRKRFDGSVNAYINKSYKVLRIIQHIPRSDQGKLELE